MKKLISSIAIGIGCGFSILVLFLTTAVLINPDFLSMISAEYFLMNVVCSAIVGLGFSVPSLIYENKHISRGLHVLIHLGTGFVIYIPTAFFAGWIPTAAGFVVVAISLLISVVFAVLIWFCFWLYHKKEADIMNKKIIEKQSN